MNLLITPRSDLPKTVADRLALIKSVFMEFHPAIPEGPLVTMLNAALEPRYRKTSARELVDELFHGMPAKVDSARDTFTKLGLKLTRAEHVRPDASHEALTSLSVAVLLQDGLHPLATLSGFHLNQAQIAELKQSDPDNLRSFDLFDWACDYEKTSPLLEPAIVVMDTAEHAIYFDQKSIVDHHRRFAPMLSNKRDPLHACWNMAFSPKKDRLERNGPKVTRLTRALGAITETSPEHASDRVKNSDWTYIAKHLWAVSGYVAEMGEIQNLEHFLADTLKYPAQIEPETILFMARTPEHPLHDVMIERYAQHALSKGDVHENDDLLMAVTHCPTLGKLVGIDYAEVIHERFGKLIADLDLETLDYVLSPVSKVWGQIPPSTDVRLIGTKICRHEGWRNAVSHELPGTIEQYYLKYESFPDSLKNGQIPPSFIPDDLVRPFAHSQMQRIISKGTAEYLLLLREQGKIDARFIIEALTTEGSHKDNSRLAKAYHQGVITRQEISAHYPSGLDRIMQADLGM